MVRPGCSTYYNGMMSEVAGKWVQPSYTDDASVQAYWDGCHVSQKKLITRPGDTLTIGN